MAIGDEKFTGVSSINDYLLLSNVENNLKTFLDCKIFKFFSSMVVFG